MPVRNLSRYQQAVEFLKEQIPDAGAEPASVLIHRAEQLGIASATLTRARADAGVHTHRKGFGAGAHWYWCRDPEGPPACRFAQQIARESPPLFEFPHNP